MVTVSRETLELAAAWLSVLSSLPKVDVKTTKAQRTELQRASLELRRVLDKSSEAQS